MGRGYDGKGGLAHRERVRQVHCVWGTSQFKPPNGTLGASSEFDQPSMSALGSSRTLDVAEPVVEGLPTICSRETAPTGIPSAEIELNRICPERFLGLNSPGRRSLPSDARPVRLMNASRRRRSRFAWPRGPGYRTPRRGRHYCRSMRASRTPLRTVGSILPLFSFGVPGSTTTS
jgi:hypothetical protein